MRQSPKELKFRPACLPSFCHARSPEALEREAQTRRRQHGAPHWGLLHPRGTAFVPGFYQTPPNPVPLLPRSGRADGSLRAQRAAPKRRRGPSGRRPRAPCAGGERPLPRACVRNRTSKLDSVRWDCSCSTNPRAVIRAGSRWLSTFVKRTLPAAWNTLEYAFSRLWPSKV